MARRIGVEFQLPETTKAGESKNSVSPVTSSGRVQSIVNKKVIESPDESVSKVSVSEAPPAVSPVAEVVSPEPVMEQPFAPVEEVVPVAKVEPESVEEEVLEMVSPVMAPKKRGRKKKPVVNSSGKEPMKMTHLVVSSDCAKRFRKFRTYWNFSVNKELSATEMLDLLLEWAEPELHSRMSTMLS